jgi:hypothetical protein
MAAATSFPASGVPLRSSACRSGLAIVNDREVAPLPPTKYWKQTMTLDEIFKSAKRISLDLAKIAHDLAHLDMKSVEVDERAALLRLQRNAHDAALAFQLALNPPKH